MIITKLSYRENVGRMGEWYLKDVNLGKSNLIVGRNAVGKTRTLNVLNALANMISGKLPMLLDGHWQITFSNNDSETYYELYIKDGIVLRELMTNKDTQLLSRRGELGKILYISEEKERTEEFHPPINKLTNQVRRDVKRYPFIEDLVQWAENYYYFSFSGVIPSRVMGFMPSGNQTQIDTSLYSHDLNLVAYLLKELKNDKDVIATIIKDVKKVGYEIKGLESIELASGVTSIRVFEKMLDFPIDQMALSQGMLRVISIIIVLNMILMKNRKGTITIDDIGEGLDYSRSSNLASVLIEKLKETDIQLIMTTNDRFLMSAIDLKYLNVFERIGKHVKSFNYKNSKKAFDEFLLTGMNNFDFFANELYKGFRDD